MTFTDLADYYNYIENDTSLPYDYNASYALKNLFDLDILESKKDECTYEIFYNDFHIHEGKLKGIIEYVNGVEYPNLGLFTDNLEYIKKRANSVINPKHKAKYNHILWESKFKNQSFANQAIDNYFLFLNSFPYPLIDNLQNHAFETNFKNLFVLSQTVNYRLDHTLTFFLSLLNSTKINGYKKYSIMAFTSEHGNKIDKAIFQNFFEYANQVVDNLTYPKFMEYYLELLIVLSQRLNLPQKLFFTRLGNYFISQAELESEPFFANQYYLRAIKQFQKASDHEKIEFATVAIEGIKKKLHLPLIQYEFEDEIFALMLEKKSKFLSKLIVDESIEVIYNFLSTDSDLFPKATVLEDEIRHSMVDLVTVVKFDINKNVKSNQKAGVQLYPFLFENITLKQLQLIFQNGYKNQKITFETLISYLKNNTWYGKDFTYKNSEGVDEGFSWIKLLSPALKSFFIQLEEDNKFNTNSNEGYILAIDSLVIKFEGLFRELSRYIGAQTIEIKKNETSERISIEKLIENEKLQEIIPQDDIALFKFLFTSSWLNLRNNTAHCFFKSTDYSVGIMFLLITALLRLGNCKLPINPVYTQS